MGVILDERKIMKLKINGAPRNILNNILGKHPFIDRGKINFYSPELILTFSQKSQWGRPPGMVGGVGARRLLLHPTRTLLLINMFSIIQSKSLLVISCLN